MPLVEDSWVKLKDVDRFEKLSGQFQSVYEEIAILSKKSPNDAINKFKLNFINGLLEQGNDFLGENYIPFGHFSRFDEDDVPQNSDVVFVLAQYLQSFEKFRADNVYNDYRTWRWKLEGGGEGPETVRPKRLRE